MTIDSLSTETLLHVFTFVSKNDLLACRLVCKAWSDLAGDWPFWNESFFHFFGCKSHPHRPLFAHAYHLEMGETFKNSYTLISLPISSRVTAVVLTKTQLVSAHLDKTLQVWNRERGEVEGCLPFSSSKIHDLFLDSTYLIAVSEYPRIKGVWKSESWEKISQVNYKQPYIKLGKQWGTAREEVIHPVRGRVVPLRVGKTKASIVKEHRGFFFGALGDTNFKIHMVDCKTGENLHTFTTFFCNPAVTCLTLFRNLLVSGHRDGKVRIWNIISKERITTLKFAFKITAVWVDHYTLCVATTEKAIHILQYSEP